MAVPSFPGEKSYGEALLCSPADPTAEPCYRCRRALMREGHMTAIARRKLLAALAGAAAWPFAVRAQQAERMRRIGVLMNRAADDPRGQHELAAFQKALTG